MICKSLSGIRHKPTRDDEFAKSEKGYRYGRKCSFYPGLLGTGFADDTGTCVLLRRYGSKKERTQHTDVLLFYLRTGVRAVGSRWLYVGIWRKSCRHCRRFLQGVFPKRFFRICRRNSNSRSIVRGVPDDVCHHHTGIDCRFSGRQNEISGNGDFHCAVVAARVLPDGTHGMARRWNPWYGLAGIRGLCRR